MMAPLPDLNKDVSFDSLCGMLDSLQHLVALHHLLQEGAGVVLERRKLPFDKRTLGQMLGHHITDT